MCSFPPAGRIQENAGSTATGEAVDAGKRSVEQTKLWVQLQRESSKARSQEGARADNVRENEGMRYFNTDGPHLRFVVPNFKWSLEFLHPLLLLASFESNPGRPRRLSQPHH